MTADRIIGALLFAIGAAFAAMALSLKVGFTSDTLGPRAYPLLVAVVLMVLSAALVLRHPPEGRASITWPGRARLFALGFALASFVIYAQLMPHVGFPLATALEVAALCLLFGARPLQAALTGVTTSAVLYLLFTRVLDLALPWGSLLES
ncbi:MAG: tripartite tricarboxylate transporter TctB family protein [Salipiger thiooxidans]